MEIKEDVRPRNNRSGQIMGLEKDIHFTYYNLKKFFINIFVKKISINDW